MRHIAKTFINTITIKCSKTLVSRNCLLKTLGFQRELVSLQTFKSAHSHALLWYQKGKPTFSWSG